MSEALSNYSFTEERLDGLVVEGQEGTRVTMIIHREPALEGPRHALPLPIMIWPWGKSLRRFRTVNSGRKPAFL